MYVVIYDQTIGNKQMKIITTLLLASLSLMISSNASAMIYGFDCFTNNNAANCSGTDSIFSLSVTETPINNVTFTISHAVTGTDTGQATEFYFDGASDQLGMYISSTPELNETTNPQNLPSQNTATPAFVTDFSLDSDFTGQTPDVPLVPGGSVDIVFALLGSFGDLIQAIENGDLRLGLHVRSIELNGSDSSESFVTTVPVPAAVWLMGTGLIGLVGFGRKRQQG